ncbi:hypothetical protein FM106_04105 [Brachybacterium faecium]|nr:hypothetical protein FM106_04105 [Brachybacterium faecium]
MYNEIMMSFCSVFQNMNYIKKGFSKCPICDRISTKNFVEEELFFSRL